MRPTTSQPRSIGHLIGSVLLLIGMAAMHHLVVSGCGSVVVDQAAVGTSVHVIEQPGPDAGDHSHGKHDADETSGTGTPVDHSGAALCLAVVVSVWLLTPLLRFRRVRRDVVTELRPPSDVSWDDPPRPPDLSLLSVSRT